MAAPTPDSATPMPPAGDAVGPPAQPARRHPGRGFGLGILLIVAIAVVGAIALRGGSPVVGPGPSAGPGNRPAGSPRLALIDDRGALAVRDRAGRTTILGADPDAAYGFPAWSPDGAHIAVIADRADGTSVEIFDASRSSAANQAGDASDRPAGASDAAPAASAGSAPRVAFRSAASRPFYLYWSPDGRWISFLAAETDGISLRVAPADGSALAADPSGVLRRGQPLYYDWVAADRLLLHVGSGAAAFVGEIGPDGSSPGPALDGSGDYRPAVASGDGRFIAFARGPAGTATLVTAHRDGSDEHALPVGGPAAMVFDPTGATLATIAADRPDRSSLSFPIGPLRLVDPETGTARTLVDGDVVGFFWSPDGRTIAVLRLQGASGSTVAANPIVAAAAFAGAAASSGPAAVPSSGSNAASSGPPESTPGATPGSELHLLFVGVADGFVRSDRIVQLTTPYVNQVLPYFDQYALSHRTWAADSSAIVLPLLDGAGAGHLVVLPADGSQPEAIPGASGFWSP